MLKILGSPISPYARKVFAVLELKKIPFEIDPVVAFFTDERFTKLSPLRRIPVLIDGDIAVADSSVIVQYLEEKHPSPTVLPGTPAERATARWLEEYADSRMGDVFLWRIFNAVVIGPSVWGGERNMASYQKALAEDVPPIMDYLESVAPASGFLFEEFSLADLSVCVFFRNLRYARWSPDAAHWPKAAAWIAHSEGHPSLARSSEWADALVKTPVADHRAKAAEIGVPLTKETFLVAGPPRKGPMTVMA